MNNLNFKTMKKSIKIMTVLVLALSFAAFTPPTEKLTVKNSSVTWVGKKITGQHEGTIDLQQGYLEMDGENIVGGKFVIDMTSLTVTDLTGEYKGKLEGHLSSDDFFGIANHPTATFEIKRSKKSGNSYTLMGDMTIKGKTQPINFNLEMNGNSATAKITIDRTKYGIIYKSGSFFDNLKDAAIKDNFELVANLEF